MERWGVWSNLHVHMNSLLVRRNWGEALQYVLAHYIISSILVF